MKHGGTKLISKILATVMITAVVALALIIEPAIKLNGFVSLDKNRLDGIKSTFAIYTKDGTNLSSATFVPLASLRAHTIDAFLCAEDKRFYSHEGIDYSRIVSAIVSDLRDGAFSQGASTITQQLMKNTHLSGDKTIRRKLNEIRLARAVERSYSKDEILEMYLNILYFGNGIYGIGSAAQSFFGKDASMLDIRESAALASIINNPALYNPYERAENLNKRTNLILRLMRDANKISGDEYNRAVSARLELKAPNLLNKYRCFVINEACKALGCTEEYLYGNDIKIICNCDLSLQKRISELIAKQNAKCVQMMVIDNGSGKIIAHEAKFGGDPSNLRRSPGSTIKPIVSYAPAIEKGIILPITPIFDQKTDFDGYNPSNYKDKYYGWVSCGFALKESLNVPAVKLLDYVGVDNAKEFAAKMGISTGDEGLALALGGMENGVTLSELASAYTVFANGGKKISSSYIDTIYKGDELIYSAPTSTKRVMSEDTAYLINEMLCECAESGTAKRLGSYGGVWAAKTGTVGAGKENTDAYCVAYSSGYTVAVHVMQGGEVTGGGLPTKLIKQLIMSDITCDKKFKMPNSIVKKDINAIEYNKNQRIVEAQKNLPKKDRISASFTKNNLPLVTDERSDYLKGLDDELFDFDNFTIVDGFGD